MATDFLFLLIFLMASGFFSGIEIAFISADRLRVEKERKKGNKRGLILANFLKNPSEFLGTTLVGNNIVLVILSLLAGHFLENYFFGTAFLMDAERFNKMAPEEKKSLNLTDPCLFGVINRLVPTKEESILQTTTVTPYKEE